ncbi:Na+/H+ antiporter subunit E [Rhodoplanes serenus]|uniref:Na+/H+ antiporter subunit E n=1 Tax=Rhodoplanes serenus TaxID=200615 RepID=A0A9X5AUU2_9BRAD|nr:Na+/H+ antiporter subunit E [Rhodoplanes serenus]MTW18755.1 Na+/H+ antiporter subunit E [Rhodoplanes serenus]
MRRLVPHPVLSVVIAVVWLALVNSAAPGHVLLAAVLGLAIPHYSNRYWPDQVVIRRPLRIVDYIAVVAWDILVSNVQVAWLVLFRSGPRLRSVLVTVPIDLPHPTAITVLTGTITMTPGTVSADVAADGRAVLVHCLDADDPDAVVHQIKDRYERRLKEIFA